MGKNNLTKIWDAKFKLAWIRRSECCHYYESLHLSHKNLSDNHSMNYSSKALIVKAKLRAITQLKKLQRSQLVTPDLNYLEVLKQRCAHDLSSTTSKFSQKMTFLAPDEGVPVGFITGQSRQMGNSTETVYQYSAINPTAASPASRKLEQSTFRLNVQQLQRHINLFPLIQLSHDLHPLGLLSFQAQGIESSDWNNLLSLKFLSKSCFKIVCILTMLYCTTSSLHSNRVTLMLFYWKFLLQKLSLIPPSNCVQSKAGIYYCYQNS